MVPVNRRVIATFAKLENTMAETQKTQSARLEQEAAALEQEWKTNPRWRGVKRSYSAADVVRLRGSVVEEHTLARRGAEKLWNLLHTEDYVHALGALTGNQAVQQVRAGLKAIHLRAAERPAGQGGSCRGAE